MIETETYTIGVVMAWLSLRRDRFDDKMRLLDVERAEQTMTRWMRRKLGRQGLLPVAGTQAWIDCDVSAPSERIPAVAKLRAWESPIPDDVRPWLQTLVVAPNVSEVRRLAPSTMRAIRTGIDTPATVDR